jgi:hypothetical protein
MGHVRQTIKRWNAVLYVFICMDITVKKWCHWRREWAHSMYTCTINVPITTILDKLLKKFWLKECIWQPSLYLPTISRSWKNPIYLHFAYYQNIWLDHLKYKLLIKFTCGSVALQGLSASHSMLVKQDQNPTSFILFQEVQDMFRSYSSEIEIVYFKFTIRSNKLCCWIQDCSSTQMVTNWMNCFYIEMVLPCFSSFL